MAAVEWDEAIELWWEDVRTWLGLAGGRWGSLRRSALVTDR
jgi:hypothetical protein